jgi:SAM-dependent methyltransferase
MSDESNRWLRERSVSGDDYDANYEQRAAAGENVHGEADFVEGYAPASVLDAGCGTGRVGRELARRGLDVVGVDIDPAMLATARRKAPKLEWHQADLAAVDLGRTVDAIVLAGNVMIFLAPGSEGAVLANLARHLAPGGRLIAGFQLQPGRLTVAHYDELAAAAGLALAERFSTWDGDDWHAGADYAVSVHVRRGDADSGPRGGDAAASAQ